jgi:geranylgeranyl diphosphate synthase type II
MYGLEELGKLYETKFSGENFKDEPLGLYNPVRHIMGMKGKRIRPMLVLLSCDMFGGDVNTALYPAYAMEVFHNFTLVHDDIMDAADIRRGEPTVHKKFGVNAAILAGDVMLSYAYKFVTQVPHHKMPAILDVFNQTAIEIYEGQQMDVDFEKRLDVTEQEYLKMIEFKTSVLLAASLQIGAILGGADVEAQKLIYQFGLNLGLSFQIKDDYLDTFGEGDKVGKRIGGDIVQNKKTYLLETALNIADATRRKQLLNLLNEKDEEKKISSVIALFNELQIPAKTLAKAEELYNLSIKSLEAINLPAERKTVLLQLADSINKREY